MKKWIIVFIVVCLMTILPLSLLYRDFKSTEVESAERALTTAMGETSLASVNSIAYYPGDQGYHVIIGENNTGEEIIIWTQEDNVWEESLADGVSEQHITAQLPQAEIKRIIPGMLSTDGGDKKPIWDVYYVTETGEIRYEYFDFFTGESLRTIPLARIAKNE